MCPNPPAELTPGRRQYLVDVMYVGEPVELGVHGVEHVDDVDGLAGGADVGEGDDIAEQNCAHLKLP